MVPAFIYWGGKKKKKLYLEVQYFVYAGLMLFSRPFKVIQNKLAKLAKYC